MAYVGMGNTDAQCEIEDVSMSDNRSLPDIGDLLHDSYSEVQTRVTKHPEQLKRYY